MRVTRNQLDVTAICPDCSAEVRIAVFARGETGPPAALPTTPVVQAVTSWNEVVAPPGMSGLVTGLYGEFLDYCGNDSPPTTRQEFGGILRRLGWTARRSARGVILTKPKSEGMVE